MIMAILSLFFFANANAQKVSRFAPITAIDNKVRENSKLILSNKPIKISEIDKITSTKEFTADDEIYMAIVLPYDYNQIAEKRGNGDLIFNIRKTGSSMKQMINYISYEDVNDPENNIIRVHMTRKDTKLARGWKVETKDLKEGENKISISVNFEKISGGTEVIIGEVSIIYTK